MATRTQRKATEHKESAIQDIPVDVMVVDEPVAPVFALEIANMIDTTKDLDRILAGLHRELDALKTEYVAKLAAGENPVRIGQEIEAKAREISTVLMRSVTYYTQSIPALSAI